MVRSNDWWAESTAPGSVTFPAVFDLLNTSGLNVPGATVRRCVGTVNQQGQRALAHRKPTIRLGLLVAATPDGTEIDPGNWNNHDWMHLTTRAFGGNDEPVGDRVFTNTSDPSGSWDVAVNRVFEAGESLWLIYTVSFLDTSTVSNTEVFARTLVLSAP